MTNKTNANIGFEKQLWDAACVLWGHIPAAEYRKVIIGLIFLRYISAAFDKRYQELVDEIRRKLGAIGLKYNFTLGELVTIKYGKNRKKV